MNNPTDDYDSPWKEALTRYFPLAYQAINWSQPHIFLDQELAQIVRDGEIVKWRIDRLVQVTTLTSEIEWVYIHIEVQSQVDSDFSERLFTYTAILIMENQEELWVKWSPRP